MVTPTDPARSVRRRNEGIDLRPGSIPHELLVLALGGDGQYTCDNLNTLGIAQGDEAEKRAQGGQSNVARSDRVASLLFQVVEKSENGWRVQIGQA